MMVVDYLCGLTKKHNSIFNMKPVLIGLAIFLSIITSCSKNEKSFNKYPDDKELFNHSKDAEVATRKPPHPPKGGVNNPPDTVINPPSDTVTGEVCIFLDHDGAVLNNTVWNTSGTLTLTPSGLTDVQKEEIRLKVASDYGVDKGFVRKIIVTDVDSVFKSYPLNRRVWVIITSYHEWYQASAGGVAYVNSYTWSDDTPCFVFSKAYGYNEDYIAHASSHEPGHMFGCRHQSYYDENCNLIDSYRSGWIMGRYAGYTSIFGIGQSFCCTCIQDDISTINTNL